MTPRRLAVCGGLLAIGALAACHASSSGGDHGSFTLTIHVSGNGTTDPAPGVYSFPGGTVKTITALPASGATFAGWHLDSDSSAPTITVTMDQDRTMAAAFTGGDSAPWTAPMPTYDNPVLPGDHPDMNVYVEGADFYLVGSAFNMTPNLEVLHSTDLVHWERLSRVVDPAWSGLSGSIAGGGTWGGFIVKVNGVYRVYFAVNFGQYFAEASSLAGPWSAPTQVNSFPYTPSGASLSFNRGNGYDDSVFTNTDGTTYLLVKAGQCTWNGLSGGNENNFGINQLIVIDPATGLLVQDDQHPSIDLSFMNDDVTNGGCGANVNTNNWAEGPTMVKRDGFYYYFVATHTGCGGKEYTWRSASLTSDPSAWTPLGEFLAGDPPFNGAQHNTAPFQLADGTWWAFSHSYECGGWEGLARQGLLSQVTWQDDSAAGGAGAAIPTASHDWTTPAPIPALPPSGVPFLAPFSDEFDGPALRTGWTFMGPMPATRYSVTDRPGWLRVKPGAGRTVHVVEKDALHASAMVTRLDFTPSAAGNAAGLRVGNAVPAEQVASLGSWSNPVSLELSLARVQTGTGDQLRFALGTFSFTGAPTLATQYTTASPAGSLVWLKIVRADHEATGWYSTDGLVWTQLGQPISVATLDSNQNMGNSWVSNQAGVFATNQDADFDLFTYRDGYTAVPAKAYQQHDGATVVTSEAQGQVLAFADGDWALYAGLDLGSGGRRAGAAELTVAAAGAGGTLELWTDPLAGGARIATCGVGLTGGAESWTTVTCPLDAAGAHDVYVRAAGGSGEVVRLAALRFVPVGEAPSTTVATPVFRPGDGSFTSAQDVTISTTTADATIYYTMTTDGVEPLDPTTSSTRYGGSIRLDMPASGSTTYWLKARAVRAGYTDSSVASASYVLNVQTAVNLLASISAMDTAWLANTQYWNHWTGDGATDVTVSSGTYAGMTGSCWQGTSPDYGPNPWDVQLAAGDTTSWDAKVFTLQKGKAYTIRLKGAASGPATIGVGLQINGTYDDAFSFGGIALTSTTQTFTSTPFSPSAATDVKFLINMGNNPANTTIYLDDVELLEENAP